MKRAALFRRPTMAHHVHDRRVRRRAPRHPLAPRPAPTTPTACLGSPPTPLWRIWKIAARRQGLEGIHPDGLHILIGEAPSDQTPNTNPG